MRDKLEIFIDDNIHQFDAIELPKDLWSKIDSGIQTTSLKTVKSKLLSKFIYLGLSTLFITGTIIFFVSNYKDKTSSLTAIEKTKDKLNDNKNYLGEKQDLKNDTAQPLVILSPAISKKDVEDQKTDFPVCIINETVSLQSQDTSKIKAKDAEKLVDDEGVERGIFYHISANGGPDIKRHALFWYTHKEIPNTYFIVEQHCWNKWVERGKYTGKGIPGHGEYAGKIQGKFLYKYKLPAHSGENGMRVLLMNDSNVCIAMSKELFYVNEKVPKVNYTLKKRDKEIHFSAETYFELYDPEGELVEKTYAKILSYKGLKEGTYKLNYDNTSTSIKLK